MLRALKSLDSLSHSQTEGFKKDEVFGKIISLMEVAALSEEDRMVVTEQMLQRWNRNAIDGLQREQGREEGIQQGLGQGLEQGLEQGRLERDIEMYQRFKGKGWDDEKICQHLEWAPETLGAVLRATNPPKAD